jgi:hypothetical protein
VVGPDYQGPLDCLRHPARDGGLQRGLAHLPQNAPTGWAWPPMLFDNPPAKVKDFLDVMHETGTRPEFECFDVASCAASRCMQAGLYAGRPEYTSSWAWPRACRPIPICCPSCSGLIPAPWQSTVIGRAEIWPAHRRTAERRPPAQRPGGHLHLPDGESAATAR